MTRATMARVELKAPAEVEFKELFKVRLLLGVDDKKRIVPSELAEVMGLASASFRSRVHRQFQQGCFMMKLPYEGSLITKHPSPGGGEQLTLTLELKYLPALLLGIDVSRVRAEIRPRLKEIQDELYEALAAYTFEGVAVNPAFGRPALEAKLYETRLAALEEQVRLLGQATLHPKDVRTLVAERVHLAVAALPPARPGLSAVAQEEVRTIAGEVNDQRWLANGPKWWHRTREIVREELTDALGHLASDDPENPIVAYIRGVADKVLLAWMSELRSIVELPLQESGLHAVENLIWRELYVRGMEKHGETVDVENVTAAARNAAQIACGIRKTEAQGDPAEAPPIAPTGKSKRTR